MLQYALTDKVIHSLILNCMDGNNKTVTDFSFNIYKSEKVTSINGWCSCIVTVVSVYWQQPA